MEKEEGPGDVKDEPDKSDQGLSLAMIEQKKMNSIQAVSSHWAPEAGVLSYAVSRYDKTLAIYSVSTDQFTKQKDTSSADFENRILKIKPTIVHKTNKRSCSLAFASIPPMDKDRKPITIIVAGDLSGDTIAYSTKTATEGGTELEKKAKEANQPFRVLLGHTASVLTSIEIVEDDKGCSKILTSDRDEKVRVSSFPQTFHVEGYLLGHSSYVSDIKVIRNSQLGPKCITCSGDGTMKLFDYQTCQEVTSISIPVQSSENEVSTDSSPIPVRLAINASGTVVAVMYCSFHIVQLFSITMKADDDSGTTIASLDHLQSIDCQTNPLGIVFTADNSMNILTSDPKLIRLRCGKDGLYTIIVDDQISTTLQNAITQDIKMPKSLLEVDKNSGKLKLMKKVNQGNENFGKNEPWLKRERVDIYKAGVQRRKQRKFEEKKKENNTLS